jgi:hypothetical protein
MNTDSANTDSANSGPMDSGLHERARRMISSSTPETPGLGRLSNAGFSRADQSWLAAHLESCPSCREFAENSHEAIRSLRGIPFRAGERLVSMTQMRVRQRAQELQRQQERFWVVCICCAAVTLSTVVTTAILWHTFAWIGQQARLSAPLWEGSFVVFYLMPAVLAGILLLACGTFLADRNGAYRE